MNKYQLYRKLWTDSAENLEAPKVPINIDLELTKACNLSCAMCPASIQKSTGMMEYSLAKKILYEAAEIGVKSVKMNWRGEPTLYPYFNEISKLAHELGFIDILLNTNGMYKGSMESFIKHSLYKYYTTVVFSLDAYDVDIFRQCRAGSNPELIFHNFYEMKEYQKEYQRPAHIVVNHVRQKLNWNEYEILKGLCERMNVKFRAMLAFPRTDVELHDKENMPNVLGRKPCAFPFQRLTIGYNGNVYPCCCLWNDDEGLRLGNAKTESLMDIWMGGCIEGIRREQIIEKSCTDSSLKMAKLNPVCDEKCVSWLTFKTDKPTLFNSYDK